MPKSCERLKRVVATLLLAGMMTVMPATLLASSHMDRR